MVILPSGATGHLVLCHVVMGHDIEVVLAPTQHLLMVERTALDLTRRQRTAALIHALVIRWFRFQFGINLHEFAFQRGHN
ncbi:hypothetical protein AC249_AIPGENE14167 [Exaiptasia diaphana]|nr:hypothetical protein AC249_AIPGENE14167 [Exaiptasia diaphana]